MNFSTLSGQELEIDPDLVGSPGINPIDETHHYKGVSPALNPNNPLTDIPGDISREVFELLPAIFKQPDLVLRNADYYLLRPRAFQSSALYLGDLKPLPLGVLLENWFKTNQFVITTVREQALDAGPDDGVDAGNATATSTEAPDAIAVSDESDFSDSTTLYHAAPGFLSKSQQDHGPIQHLLVYRACGSPLTGNHSAWAVTADGRQHITLGPFHGKASLPGKFYQWYNLFKQVSYRAPYWLKDQHSVLGRLRKELGVQ